VNPHHKEEKEPSKNPPNPPGGEGAFPSNLDTVEFRLVWAEWLGYRKNLKPATIARQLAKLAVWGPARAAAALNHTITQGYAGIVEPPAGAAAAAPDPGTEEARRQANTAELRRRREQQDAQACNLTLEKLNRHCEEQKGAQS
jgi:hypothetical protein